MNRLICLILFLSAVLAEKDEDTFIPNFIPLYFESNQSITIAKQHLMKHLSPEKSDVVSYAVILGVIGRLAQDYIVDSKNFDPFSSLYYHIEYAVRNYNTTLNEFKDIILEVTRKIDPVQRLLSTICEEHLSCNSKMNAAIKENPLIYRRPAQLFIHVGKISKKIMQTEALVNNLTETQRVKQYLTEHILDKTIMEIVRKVARTYVILKKII